jgi:uncharacterized membrane-anchored protein YjiN (DUF445 family)
MDNNYINEEKKLRKKLKSMRIIATSLLLLMTIVFIIFKRYENKGLLFSSIVAFAEASMVGALADWFAVVALFRHPLGLKIIPHTAIIQNNKERIARALSNFVVGNFFTPELITAKLDKISVSSKISEYISDNNDKLSKGIATKLPRVLDTVIDDSRLKGYVKSLVIDKAEEIKLYPTLSKLLLPVVEAGHHKPLVKGLLNGTYNFISDNREKTMQVLGGINKTFTMPFIGDIIYKKILEFLLTQMEELDYNEDAEINRLLMSALPKLFDDMQNDEELVEKGEQLKKHLLESDIFIDLLDKLGDAVIVLKTRILNDEEDMCKKISSVLNIVVRSMNENTELRKSIDDLVLNAAEEIVSHYGDKIGDLIYDTMDGWETKDMVDKLEVQVGADLQYIRINGTVIGGLAGLVIHLLSQLF